MKSEKITNFHIKYPSDGFPRRIFYKKIVGPEVSQIQMSDAVFDLQDYKIRKLPISPELLEKVKNDSHYIKNRKFF